MGTVILVGIIMVFLLFVAFYAWVMSCVRRNQKRLEKDGKHYQPDSSNSSSRLDPGTKLMLGAMGAKLLDDQIEEQKQKSEKRRYDSLYWQESIRDKNPSD